MEHTKVIDLNWMGHPRAIACALVRSENSIALIDPGPASTVSTLREQLAASGLKISDVNEILLTHIHLDHAGATGTLVRENPRLNVYVHDAGAPHMKAPERLLNSAARLYGDSMQNLYGEFLPVPAENLRPLRGGETLSLAGRTFRVLYTPGHASHHVTYFDEQEGTAFVGDTGGISVNGHPFILPATPPPDISIEAWEASLDAIRGLHPHRLFLTHFAFADHPAEHIERYRSRLHHWSERTANLLASGLDEEACIQKFSSEVATDAATYLTPEELDQYSFAAALNLSWMGLARYHRKRTGSSSTSVARQT
jgi:glyoxylase-like metal-dependent hydrolase (beta-lactamase superfamily II)